MACCNSGQRKMGNKGTAKVAETASSQNMALRVQKQIASQTGYSSLKKVKQFFNPFVSRQNQMM